LSLKLKLNIDGATDRHGRAFTEVSVQPRDLQDVDGLFHAIEPVFDGHRRAQQQGLFRMLQNGQLYFLWTDTRLAHAPSPSC
jgi:hypothetical protein